MARTSSQNKRPRKQSSETRPFYGPRSRKPTEIPFTMRTRSRAKTPNVVIEVISTQHQATVSMQQGVDTDKSTNRSDISSPLSALADSSSESDDGLGVLDPFRWSADEQSESTFVRHLQKINSTISDALVPVLCKLKERMRYYENKSTIFHTAEHPATKNLDPRLVGPLVQELYAARISQSRFIFSDDVIEALLQDTICVALHQRFFAGKIFFGIEHTPDQKLALDRMFESLLKKETWTVAQRWRSLASLASTLAPQVAKDTLAGIVSQIKESVLKAFNIVYPTKSRAFQRLINTFIEMLQKPIEEIVKMAHSLSISLQHEVVTSRLEVILSLPQGNETAAAHGSRALGTASMGLRAIRPGSDERLNIKVLLAPRITTASLFSTNK